MEIARASGLTTRTIRRIRNGDASGKEFINFPTFEKVAIAIGRDDLIHDDSLEIVSLTEARKSARVNATRPTGRSRTQ